MSRLRKYLLFFAGCFLATGAWAAQPSLTVGSASGQAGAAVNLPISFDPGTTSVASLQFNLTLPRAISTVSVAGGAILTSASKSIRTNLIGNTWTFVIFAINQNTIASGTLLTAQVKIASGTAARTLNVPISGIVYSDPKGQSIPPGASKGGKLAIIH